MTDQPRYPDLSEWTFSSKGSYSGRLDRRDLYNIEHPWVMSETGSFGQIECEAAIPKGWKPPYALHFYASDDYASEPNPQSPHDWWGIDSYVGHRFKQVLINGAVVWEMDVGDHVVCPTFCIDITPHVAPGKPFKLALRVIDKVGTDHTLPDDFTRIGTTEGDKKLTDRKFYTNVWWGDIALREQDDAKQPLPPRPMPAQAKAVSLPAESFPLPPLDLPWDGPIVLPLDTANLPATGFPVTCGIPLPCGTVRDAKKLALKDSSGTPVPAQFQLMNRWPDGSVRWVLVDLIAKNGEAPYTLVIGEATPRQKIGIRVSSMDGDVTVDTGALRLDFGSDDSNLIDKITLQGEPEPVVSELTGITVIRGQGGDEVVRTIREEVRIASRGPIRAEVEVRGKMVSRKRIVGRFVLRINAYAGQPILRLFYRVSNDTDETVNITSLDLGIPISLQGPVRTAWTDDEGRLEAETVDSFRLEQPKAKKWKVTGPSERIKPRERATGWFEFSDAKHAVQIAVRKFWQQYPKSLSWNQYPKSIARGGTIQIGLCSCPRGVFSFYQTPGEAKRHEVWLNFGESDNALAACMLNPPRLFSPDYVAATGALGPCCTRTDGKFADYGEFMRVAYKNLPPDKTGCGIRDFGDRLFREIDNQWCNNYYDHLLECIAEYRMTGSRTWFDRAEETACHLMDIDQVHYSADPAKIGAVYSYDAVGHTDGGFWDAMLRHGAALDLYYRLTGDPDARQAMIDLADFIVRNKRMTRPGGSKRDYAGVMMTCIHAYDETGDKRYLKHCRRVVEAVLDQNPRSRAGTFVDIRRGTFVEIHGNFNYYGNVPWMAAQLAEPMYMYWRITGDPDAARAVVGFAESVICEDMEPDEPGNFSGYSHHPQTGPSPTYNMLIAPMMMYAHDITGDDYFLTCARGAYDLFIDRLTEKPRTVIMWNVPTLLYFLHQSPKV